MVVVVVVFFVDSEVWEIWEGVVSLIFLWLVFEVFSTKRRMSDFKNQNQLSSPTQSAAASTVASPIQICLFFCIFERTIFFKQSQPGASPNIKRRRI